VKLDVYLHRARGTAYTYSTALLGGNASIKDGLKPFSQLVEREVLWGALKALLGLFKTGEAKAGKALVDIGELLHRLSMVILYQLREGRVLL
jgi:hypothetical protein